MKNQVHKEGRTAVEALPQTLLSDQKLAEFGSEKSSLQIEIEVLTS